MGTYYREVEGFPNYMVSRCGSVIGKSLFPLKQQANRQGYLRVGLYYKGKRRTAAVHRLVAIAFLENPDGKPEVNHIDKDISNNSVDNLEWVTCKENVAHSIEEYRGERNGFSKLTEEDVSSIKFLIREGSMPQKEIAELFRISEANISSIKHGNTWGWVE